MPRVIFHIDLDAFFVAVERARDPSLNGKPVIVGGLGNRGVVSTASYEARKFGVHSAMPMAQARRLCPQAVYLSPNFEAYMAVSRKFREVIDGFSPVVEQTSVDEAYVDMTGTERLFGSPRVAAAKIKARVRAEADVTASIGIAANKLVAKVATNKSKPDGLLLVAPGTEAAFLAPLPIRELPGLGPKTEEKLKAASIVTLGQLAAASEPQLRTLLGEHAAHSLRERAAGIDSSALVTDWEAKSISNEITFEKDISRLSELLNTLLGLSEKVGGRLRKSGGRSRTVHIRLRYSDFSTVTRQHRLGAAIDGDGAIYEQAKRLLETALKDRPGTVRLIGVGVSDFEEQGEMQLALTGVPDQRDSKVSTAVDKVRGRFGDDAIKRGTATNIRRFVAPFIRQ